MRANVDNITYGDNYNFYYSESTRSVICTTYYKGKLIKAAAKCDPADTFDMETGKKLAYLRCRYKFFKKKSAHAAFTYAAAVSEHIKARNRRQKAAEFLSDVTHELRDTTNMLNTLETDLGI